MKLSYEEKEILANALYFFQTEYKKNKKNEETHRILAELSKKITVNADIDVCMSVPELLYNAKIERRAGRRPLPLKMFEEVFLEANTSQYSDIMTAMEINFDIPFVHSEEFFQKNQDVMGLYLKISRARKVI